MIERIAVVGAGPAGLTAARTAADAGASVTLVGAELLGGRADWHSLLPSSGPYLPDTVIEAVYTDPQIPQVGTDGPSQLAGSEENMSFQRELPGIRESRRRADRRLLQRNRRVEAAYAGGRPVHDDRRAPGEVVEHVSVAALGSARRKELRGSSSWFLVFEV